MGNYDAWKKEVLKTAVGLTAQGLLVATGGNVSTRIGDDDLLAITASGKDYLLMTADDICVVDFAGKLVEGQSEPSFETDLHISVYRRRPDANAVIHTHQNYASIYALIQQPIPALFDEQVVNLGDRVEVAPYALSGSSELTEHIAAAVANRCNAYILQNHGCLVLGADLAQAARNARLLEKTAAVYFHALLLKREISLLPDPTRELLFGILQCHQQNEIDRKNEAGRTRRE